MLFSLHIQNIALLDDVEIEFKDGFNVLTGETGAGKSILISSINLLLGDRANRELIRHGADRASVSGLFFVKNDTLRTQLIQNGIDVEEDGSLLITRQLLRDGKNLCRIGNRPATLTELKNVSQLLVNIHGQHDNQSLLDSQKHIHFLDGFLKAKGVAAIRAYQDAYDTWHNLAHKAKALDMDETERLRKIDILSYELNEIRSAALEPDEEDELKKKRDVINHRIHLERSVGQAITALCDSADGDDARQALAIASEALMSATELDAELAPLNESLSALVAETEDVARSLRNYFDHLSENDQSIDEIESRLDVIYKLKRKYGSTIADVIAHGDACEKELAELQTVKDQKEKTEKLLSEAQEKAQQHANVLTSLREKAIPVVENAINETLHFLNMAEADFQIMLTSTALHRFGGEQINFMIKTNAGEDYLPLTKIVSGGELSRIMLAIKSVLTDGDNIETLIFDEIDAGVSGMAAQKIGRKLKSLAENKQILCVTHLAQIAAMANTHFLISKTTEDDRTKTEILPLSHQAQVKELARIISGEAVTETTLKQAEELIAFGKRDD
ncbi:MAG: DNA repair protein RecN [Ruminococcaceae bacterium]|nr:DNA repair protein RecN [Oscillospiraceae bacterium]